MNSTEKAAPLKVQKSDDEWRAALTPEQFYVTHAHGTERPFTGPHVHENRAGTFACMCCGAPLFDAQTKFESGTGWPSFYAPLNGEAVSEHTDGWFFMRRTEVRCASRPRIPGWSTADRSALLHERHCADVVPNPG